MRELKDKELEQVSGGQGPNDPNKNVGGGSGGSGPGDKNDLFNGPKKVGPNSTWSETSGIALQRICSQLRL